MNKGYATSTAVAVLLLIVANVMPTASLAQQSTVSAPTVPKTIKKAVRYFASVTVNLPKGARVTGISWFWSGEGPFPFPFRFRGNTVTSQLTTRNPGDYRLAAQVCYRQQEKRYCAKGKSTLIQVR